VLQHQCPAESLRVKKSLRVKNCANGQDRPLVGRPLGANLAVAIGLTSIRAVSSCDTVRKGKRQWSSLLGRRSEKPGDQLRRSTRGLISSSAPVERASCAPMARDLRAKHGARVGCRRPAVAETSSQENCPTVQLACFAPTASEENLVRRCADLRPALAHAADATRSSSCPHGMSKLAKAVRAG
jgi:hypothetical protein